MVYKSLASTGAGLWQALEAREATFEGVWKNCLDDVPRAR